MPKLMMRFILLLLLLPGLLGGGVSDSLAAVPAKKKPLDPKTMVKQLHRVSGINKEKRIIKKYMTTDRLVDNRTLKSLGLSDKHIDIINSVYKGSYRLNDYYRALSAGHLNNFNRQHVRKAIRFYRSRLGKKTVKLWQNFYSNPKGLKGFVRDINRHAPSSTRLKLFERMVKSEELVEHYMRDRASILRTMEPLNKYFDAPDSESLIGTLRAELSDRQQSLKLIEAMYAYRSLKNKELKKLVEFQESDTGQWLTQIQHQAGNVMYEKMNRRASRRLDSLIAVIESGEQDMDTIMHVFSPGLRYMFANDRDPFNPLIVKPKKKKKKKKGPQVAKAPVKEKETRFGAELEKMQTIPYELYRRLKKVDPALHSDLEYYGTLFKDRKELAALKKNAYQDEVNNYKKLIQKALDYGDRLVKTPLQTNLDGLKLSGVLWDGFGTVALVETEDSHGHTVKVGSLVGPNYGVVESINQEKMVIVERIRDFQGNIFSVTRFLEFSPSAE